MAVAAPTAPALSLRGVAKSFGGRLILDGADLELGPRARVGLIGANGAGKSTLLKMLAGEEHPDAGAVTLRRGARVAYLHQMVDGDERTVRQVLAAARPEAAALDEIRWRVERRGEDVVQSLALIGLDATDQVAMVIEGERLLCLVRERISLTA